MLIARAEVLRGRPVRFLAVALLAIIAAVGLHPAVRDVAASAPPQCEIQRLAYCLWIQQNQAIALRMAEDGTTTIDIASAMGVRAHRIIEPPTCRRAPADTSGAYPEPSEVRRDDHGWLHFTMRLRRDGSCDLRISQLREPEHRGTEYDRVMWIPIVVCHGEALASYPGGAPFPEQFTRQGTACSRKS